MNGARHHFPCFLTFMDTYILDQQKPLTLKSYFEHIAHKLPARETTFTDLNPASEKRP